MNEIRKQAEIQRYNEMLYNNIEQVLAEFPVRTGPRPKDEIDNILARLKEINDPVRAKLNLLSNA